MRSSVAASTSGSTTRTLHVSSRSYGGVSRAPRPGSPSRSSASCRRCGKTDLYKLPGVSETVEWTRALMTMDTVALDPETVDATLGLLLKYQDDVAQVQGAEAARLLAEIARNQEGDPGESAWTPKRTARPRAAGRQRAAFFTRVARRRHSARD